MRPVMQPFVNGFQNLIKINKRKLRCSVQTEMVIENLLGTIARNSLEYRYSRSSITLHMGKYPTYTI